MMKLVLFFLLPQLPWVHSQGIQVVRRGILYPQTYLGHIWVNSKLKDQVSKVNDVLNMNDEIDTETAKYARPYDDLKPWITGRNLKKEHVEDKLVTMALAMSEMSGESSSSSGNREERSVSVSLDIGQFFRDVFQGIKNFFNRSQMDKIEKTEAEHSHRINVLDHRIEELDEHMTNISANMEEHWIKYNQRLGIVSINSQYMMALEKSEHVVNTVTNSLIDLHNGRISPDLVPMDVAELAVVNSTAVVRSQGRESTMKNGMDFYTQKNSYYVENGDLSLLVSFESYDPSFVMELVEVVHFPWYDMEDQMALKLKSEKTFVAIGEEDQEGYRPAVTLSEEEFQKCRDIGPQPGIHEWICNDIAIHRNASATCLGSIVLGKPLDACEFEVPKEVKPDYKYLSDGTLVFFFPETNVVTMTCGDEVSYESAIGIFRPLIREDCELKTRDFVIPPKPSIPEIIVLQNLATVDLTMSLLKSEIDVSLDIIPSSALQNEKDRNTPNYKKHQNFQIQNPETPSSNNEYFILMLGIAVGILIFLVLLICMFLICRSCKVTSRQLNVVGK